ncbi:hypothetical protein [Pseudalkalibacillus sp. JSM 102089]|uniref:hypothetical protein n=1 Tax=Pseudalkalibacillus sp. JSM 102089 TaxID=3229856 RepID=UPI003523F9AE
MAKLNLGRISFTRTDFSIPSHIEQFGKDYADHFKTPRNYVPQFCKLIQTSKRWEMANLQAKLKYWESNFSRIGRVEKIIDLVKRSFNSCQCDDEISDLRGVMVEALIIGRNGGSAILTKQNYGWGARVDLHLPTETVAVKYNCLTPQSQGCRRRSTVDFGYWDGIHGQFYECKAQPRGIGCKEVKYMQKLKHELEQEEISHEIFFVCAAPHEEVKIRLEEDFGLRPIYHPFGIEDIRSMMGA